MKITKKRIGSILFSVIVVLGIVLFVFIKESRTSDEEPLDSIGYGSSTVKAEVTDVLEEGTVQLGEISQQYQIVQALILEGEFEGNSYPIEHGKYQILPEGFHLESGDRILVTIGVTPNGDVNTHFIDYMRTTPLLVLFAIFVAVSVLISGWQGIQSLISMVVSVMVIFYFIIPQIMGGADPILISIIGSFAFLSVTQFLVYGWTLKTHIALIAIVIAMTITGVLSVVFVNYANLNGFGDENARFLVQQAGNLNVQNLLIASIIIGALGVLDDLVIGQASAVIELHFANPDLNFEERFRSAFRIGRDHIAATVNTLLLAYLGASLMMFLLFSLNNPEYLLLLNINFIAEEIVRALVGTLGLFTAVPVTNFIACWAVDKPQRIQKLCRVLGPLTDNDGFW